MNTRNFHRGPSDNINVGCTMCGRELILMKNVDKSVASRLDAQFVQKAMRAPDRHGDAISERPFEPKTYSEESTMMFGHSYCFDKSSKR